MHTNSHIVHNSKEDLENKLLIEKWMKRNTSICVSTSQDTNPTDVLVNKSSEITNKKHSCNYLSGNLNNSVIKKKIAKISLPTKNTEVQSVNKCINTSVQNNKSNTLIGKTNIASKISKNSSYSINCIKKSADNMKVEKVITTNGKTCPVVQSNVVKTASTAQSNEIENDVHNKNSLKYLLCKEKDADIYTSLLENYRYLITPKSWSVTEFTSETKNRYVVFFNAHVIQENNTLISVMRKSLIIDKGATMNYSVHGLPVDINGTILPSTLDNTKKLLSILHIFDKMQVCDGIGNDLNITQTDFVFKDNCRFWRHKHCKVILIKATRCLICTETRNYLLESK